MLHDPKAKIQEFWVEDNDAVCELFMLLLFHDEFWWWRRLKAHNRAQKISITKQTVNINSSTCGDGRRGHG